VTTIKTIVKRFEQGGVEMYVGTLSSKDILAIHAVDVRDEAHPDGYQRIRDPARCRKVAEFVRNTVPRILPANIIINLRGKGSFTPLDGYDCIGVLEMPTEEGTAWVVDGQHRLGGFDELEAELQMELPVVVFKDLGRRLEMFHFKVINEEQKKVNLSLALELMGDLRGDLMRGPSWKLTAHDIVKRLNDDTDSPWQAQINMTGARGVGRPVNQVTFVNALRPLIDSAASSFSMKSLDEQVAFLKDFWHAVAEVFPAPWSSPRGHLLKKGFGVATLSRVAGRVYALCERDDDFSPDNIRRLVQRLGSFNWHSKAGHFAGYGGTLGIGLATDQLLKALQADTP
jgi:DGQHR domain-containing protein